MTTEEGGTTTGGARNVAKLVPTWINLSVSRRPGYKVVAKVVVIVGLEWGQCCLKYGVEKAAGLK